MHPNLVVFQNYEKAHQWVKTNLVELATLGVAVAFVDNPTEKFPQGLSIIFS